MARKQDENTEDINRISSTCGKNVVVKGNTAEWCSVDSGGRLFVEQPLTQHPELVLELTESGYADVGILTVDPNFLSDVTQVGSLSEFTVIQNAKIHHQTGIIQLKRSQNGDKIVLRTDGEDQYFEVNKSDDIWITVNIIYGTLKVQINSGFFFKISAVKRGENTSISSNQREAHLNIVNPCAVCFFERPIMRGETLCFSVEPIVRDGRATQFSFKVAITEIHPEEFLPAKPYIYDITFLPVSHFENSFKKVQGDIAFQYTTEGVASVQYKTNQFILHNITFEKSYLLIELCKVKLKYLYKRNESLQTELYKGNESLQTEPFAQVTETTSSASPRSIDYTDEPNGPVIPTGPSANVPHDPELPTSPSANVPHDPEIPTGPSSKVPDSPAIPTGPSANAPYSLGIPDVTATTTDEFDSKNQLDLIRREVDNLSIKSNENNESINDDLLPVRGEAECYLWKQNDLHQAVEGIYKRLQSIEERLRNNTSKDASLSDIKEIKRMLAGFSAEPVKLRVKANVQISEEDDRSVFEVIQPNFTEFVQLLDTVPFLDRMFQRDHLTLEEYERIRISSQTNRVDANRELSLIIFRRQSVDLTIFKQYLIETKQDGVLSILFPK